MYPAIMQQKQEEAADKETEKHWAVVKHTQRGDTSEWIRWTTKDWDPKSSYSPIQILAFESFWTVADNVLTRSSFDHRPWLVIYTTKAIEVFMQFCTVFVKKKWDHIFMQLLYTNVLK